MAQGRKQGQRRLVALTAGSVVAHGLVFLLLGLDSPGLRAPAQNDVEAFELSLVSPNLQPRPLPAGPDGQPRIGEPGRQAIAPPAYVPPSAPLPSPILAPSPDQGRAIPGANDIQRRAAAPFIDDSPDARRVLRGTYGCAYADDLDLTPAEREDCRKRYADRPAPPVGLATPGDKRSRWDRQAAKQRADREWRENPTVPVGTDESQGPGRPAGLGRETPATATFKTPF
ncbi:hypothetical protein GVN21_04540 [Caulobacter sp. SLTY]|uniref:hypothetical protein n=1 Tax=Caulobacter sp. SLTY TaxID=2683262 RepID=UPI001411B3D4|nr:hypothetical protein [Caulobacter sp. SLTY]NBB14628.1 hypothetical protein [Caulobacter sp. SLTY]